MRLLQTTSQADVAGPNLRQPPTFMPSLIAGDGQEVRLYAFDGYSLSLLASLDAASDVLAGALNPTDGGRSLAIASNQEPSLISLAPLSNTETDPFVAQLLRLLVVDDDAHDMNEVSQAFPIGNGARSLSFNVPGTFLASGNAGGQQNYDDDEALSAGVWNNTGVWRVLEDDDVHSRGAHPHVRTLSRRTARPLVARPLSGSPRLSLLGAYATNHETLYSVVAPSPDGQLVYAAYLGTVFQTPNQTAQGPPHAADLLLLTPAFRLVSIEHVPTRARSTCRPAEGRAAPSTGSRSSTSTSTKVPYA